MYFYTPRLVKAWIATLLMGLLAPLTSLQAQSGADSLLFVCMLDDYADSNAHAIWLDILPGAPSERFNFDSAGGLMVIYADSTARITGRVVHESLPNWQWDLDMWLINGKNYAEWSALGRQVKVEQAPLNLVNANKQDWFFGELDSTRSKLTGVPGTFFDGDTLNLSHMPADFTFGFQVGIAANAKNGSFGMSGWFFYSGSYNGHGDINVRSLCCPAVCDLVVDSVNAECTSDTTFEVTIGLSGTGVHYVIEDDQGNPPSTYLDSGVYVLGPYPSGTQVTFSIYDDLIPGCDTTIHVTEDCTPPPVCDLALVGVTPNCTSDSTFEVSATFTGTGVYTLSDNFGNSLTGLSAGTYTFTDYANGDSVIITVSDENIANCDTTAAAVTEDCTPPPVCDLALVGVTPNCTSDSTFEVSATFTGTGVYTLSDNFGNSLTGLSAGTYTFTDYANGDSVIITVSDENIANCDTTAAAVTEDCTPPPVCDLALVGVTPNCTSDSTFEVSATFTGTGVYTLSDNFGNSLTGLSAGTYTFTDYANGDSVIITVSDENIANCDTTAAAVTEDCTPPPVCDLALVGVTPNCTSDSTFEVSATFTGTGVYTLSDNFGNSLTGLSAGTYTFTDYANGDSVIITVSDENIANCDTTAAAVTEDCTPPPVCDLALVSVTPNCTSDSTFEVSATFTGTGVYTLSDNFGNSLTGLSAGTYTFTDYANGDSVIITVSDENIANCDTTAAAVTEDCTPPPVCDLALVGVTPNCTSDSTFEVSATFTGTGVYTLSDNFGNSLTGLSAGTYTFTNYANGDSVIITVSDENIANCDTTAAAVTEDCTPPPVCDLALVGVTPNCTSDSTFEVSATFTGTGVYTLSDNFGNSLTGLSAGTYTFTDYANGDSVIITVSDENIANCDTTAAAVTEDCTPPPVCDLALVGETPNCTSDSTFEVSATFTGTGVYTLSDNFGNSLTGLSAGTYTFTDYANGDSVIITVSDENIANCDTTSGPVSVDCGPPPVCDVAILDVMTSCITDTTFDITVTLGGLGNSYTLIDDQGSAIQSGLSAGSYTFGPYANNTQVAITASDPLIGGCDTTASPVTNDCFPFICDVALDTIFSLCISDSFFNVMVTFTGTGSNFTISDDVGGTPMTGLSEGTYAMGPYFNSTDVTIFVSNESIPNCTDTQGPVTADCTPVPVCDISIDSAYTNCLTDSTFELVVTFSGSGGNYTLTDAQSLFTLTGLTAGTYSFGSYASGTSVGFLLIDPGIFGCFLTGGPLQGDCAPPVNAMCQDAILLPCETSITGTTRNSPGADEPALCDSGSTGAGVWYQINGRNDVVTLDVCSSSGPAQMSIQVYLGTCGQLTCVEGASDALFCANGGASLDFKAEWGKEYRVYVNSSTGTDFTLDVACQPATDADLFTVSPPYPNPTFTGEFSIDLNSLTPFTMSWRLLDVQGVEQRSGTFPVKIGDQTETFDVADLPSGIYFFQITAGFGNPQIFKVVVNN